MAKASNKGGKAPKTATPTTVAQPAQVEASPKAKRPPAEVQNGVTRPRAGGKCAAVWEITEANMQGGNMPDIAKVKEAAKAAGLNPTNVSIEYYRCRQFHGVRGRQAKVEATQQ